AMMILYFCACSKPEKKSEQLNNQSTLAAVADTSEKKIKDEFVITAVKKNNNYFAVELNNCFTINFIELEGNKLLLPANRNPNTKKEFKYISADSVLIENFFEKMKKTLIEFSKNPNMTFAENYKKFTPHIVDINIIPEEPIKKTKKNIKKRKQPIKASVTLVSEQGLIITNILISEQKDKLVVGWPQIIYNKKRIPVIEFKNKDDFIELNNLILNKYFEKIAVK
ncbi:MAG TPA: hypothetical protein PLJ38_07990, partial [bacterium]|nr:hypothetical protein [bacterium]